jgi:hypothetical protein
VHPDAAGVASVFVKSFAARMGLDVLPRSVAMTCSATIR